MQTGRPLTRLLDMPTSFSPRPLRKLALLQPTYDNIVSRILHRSAMPAAFCMLVGDRQQMRCVSESKQPVGQRIRSSHL